MLRRSTRWGGLALALAWLFLPSAASARQTGDAPDSLADDEPVSILDAQRDGQLDVVARGQGPDRVRFTISNRSPSRLRVVLPPGLVAAAGVGQGFQSMGLGLPTDQPGRFGRTGRLAAANPGFRSVAVQDGEADADTESGPVLAIPPGQTIELTVPSVCLNFGAPTPTPAHIFTLMDVDDYTSDPRARKALRSLAVLGTSQGVAQCVAWHVFNGMSWPRVAKEASRYVNPLEVSLASRFVEALDSSDADALVDGASLREARVLVRVQDAGNPKLAQRLRAELAGQRLLGLSARVVEELGPDESRPSTLLVDVLAVEPGARADEARVRVLLRYHAVLGGWTRLGTLDLSIPASPASLTGDALADALDRGLAGRFVTATPARRGAGTTTLRIVNRLPFTLENVVLRTGRGDDAPRVVVPGLGIGPNRGALATVPAPIGVVERVELNGL
jgi:hypothetical protein